MLIKQIVLAKNNFDKSNENYDTIIILPGKFSQNTSNDIAS